MGLSSTTTTPTTSTATTLQLLFPTTTTTGLGIENSSQRLFGVFRWFSLLGGYFFSVQRLHGFRQVVQHVQLHVAKIGLIH